jgi:hypothetical protein
MSTEQVAKGPPDDGAVWAINEWCVAARVSPAFFFKRAKAGCGPRTASCGRRTIVIESPREYYERLAREAESARPQVVEAV